ncbi:MAG: glycosyl transferase, partial [Verrucomicrobiia bacterium]
GRLLFPLAFPNTPYQFAKGYCARFSRRLHGRVMRLFLAPLLRTLAQAMPQARIIRLLMEFRYPLAGEVAFTPLILGRVRLPSHWGVEVGMLDEISRLLPLEALCQSELGERYDHKHQDLSPDDPSRGLHRMAYDVGLEIFRILIREGLHPPADVRRRFEAESELLRQRYELEAALNGLEFDAASEDLASRVFARALDESLAHWDCDINEPLPAWNDLLAAEPTLGIGLDQLVWPP